MKEFSSSPATLASFAQLVAARPMLTRVAPVGDLVALPERTLLHAGPPYRPGQTRPVQVLEAAAAAAVLEGWYEDRDAALCGIADGDVALKPAQDFGVVTPLAYVVGPSVHGLMVEDAAGIAMPKIAPLNDGPAPAALRFGRAEGAAYVRRVSAGLGPALARSLETPIDVLALMAEGLGKGDELHGRVSAANAALLQRLPALPEAAAADLLLANQFVLNVLMAGAALMLAAGAGVAGSALCSAAGGNGVDFGWQRAGEPGRWIVAPALPPEGPRLSGHAATTILPAIGDSAVIDACGFGAAAMRFSPDLLAAFAATLPDSGRSEAAHAAYVGPHPLLPFAGLRLGLDLDRVHAPRGVMLAMLDASGDVGLVGRGIAPWPKEAHQV